MRNGSWAAASLCVISISVNATELDALAEAIYFEARSEPFVCQVVLAQSILNRVAQKRYPDTVESVVRQKTLNKYGKYTCQYSYYCDGQPDKMTDYMAELRSYQTASRVLMRDLPDFSNGADHYYNPFKASPSWGNELEGAFMCGNHRFGRHDW